MNVKTCWVLGLASLLLVPCWSVFAADDEAKQPEKKAAAKEAPKPAKEDAEEKDDEEKDGKEKDGDQFAVPKDAKPEELMKFVERLLKKRPNVRTQEELIAHFKKLSVAVLDATSKVLDAKDVDEEVATEAFEAHAMALDIQGQLGNKDAPKQELEFVKKYTTDSREKIAEMAKERYLFSKLKNIKDLKEKEQDELFAEAMAKVKGKEGSKLTEKSLQLASMIGQLLERGNETLAAKAYDQFAELFAHTGDDDLEAYAKRFTKKANQLRLVGNPIDIEGTLVDGRKIDWAAYKGKVVLVDFWATWCGPCIAEMPNVKRNYYGYKAKGFDVVGISLDNSKAKLENFIKKRQVPWSNLFSEDEDATGWQHPLADKYGVNSIPFTVLVGKDGNVIKLGVRGDALGEALADLLGPIDEEAVKAAEEAEEKAAKAAEEAEEKAAEEAEKKEAAEKNAKKEGAAKKGDKDEEKDEKKE